MSERKPDVPAVNWLVHVLNDLTSPGSSEIDLGKAKGGSKEGWAKFDSPETQALFLDMAAMFKEHERERWRLAAEGRAAEWIPVSTPPDHCNLLGMRYRYVLATSPALSYVCMNGIVFARYNGGEPSTHKGSTWEVQINNIWIRHTPSHWRAIPPRPESAPPYKDVEIEADNLRRAAGLL